MITRADIIKFLNGTKLAPAKEKILEAARLRALQELSVTLGLKNSGANNLPRPKSRIIPQRKTLLQPELSETFFIKDESKD